MTAINIKELQAISKYNGVREEFPQWRFVFTSLVNAQAPQVHAYMTRCEGLADPVQMNTMSVEEQDMSRKVMFALSQVLGPESLTLVMNVEASNGFEAW